MPQSALHQYKAPLTGGEKHISGMEVFRQHQFHKVRRRRRPCLPPALLAPAVPGLSFAGRSLRPLLTAYRPGMATGP